MRTLILIVCWLAAAVGSAAAQARRSAASPSLISAPIRRRRRARRPVRAGVADRHIGTDSTRHFELDLPDVPGKPGAQFGIEFRVEGEPRDDGVTLYLTLIFPPQGIYNPNIGTTMYAAKIAFPNMKIGARCLVGYGFDNEGKSCPACGPSRFGIRITCWQSETSTSARRNDKPRVFRLARQGADSEIICWPQLLTRRRTRATLADNPTLCTVKRPLSLPGKCNMGRAPCGFRSRSLPPRLLAWRAHRLARLPMMSSESACSTTSPVFMPIWAARVRWSPRAWRSTFWRRGARQAGRPRRSPIIRTRPISARQLPAGGSMLKKWTWSSASTIQPRACRRAARGRAQPDRHRRRRREHGVYRQGMHPNRSVVDL